MRCRSIVLAAVLVALSVPATAQDRVKPLDIQFGLGFTIPTSETITFGTASSFPFGVTYNINERLGIQGNYWFNKFGNKDIPANTAELPENPDYIASVPLTANRSMHVADASLVFALPWKGQKMAPYVLAGVGFYQQVINVTAPGSTSEITVCEPAIWLCYPTSVPAAEVVGQRRSNDFGFNLGGGATLRLGDLARLFVEVRYVHTFGPTVQTPSGATLKANGNYIPIVFGFKL